MRHLASALLCSLLLPAAALASTSPSELDITNAFARPTPPGATNAGAYADIRVTGDPVTLVSARSPASEVVELHIMRMEGDTMVMRQVKHIDINQNEPLTMRPGGGYHLMLIGLEAPLTEGQTFPITLEFEAREDIDVEFEVAPMGDMSHSMPNA